MVKAFIAVCCSLLLTPLLAGCQNTAHMNKQITMPARTAIPSDATVLDASTMAMLKSKQHRSVQQGIHRPKIALVLGSGGARGYAHIGVIQVLEQYGLRPDLIVGTSAGSIVGAIYASGKTASQMQQMATDLKTADVRDFTFTRKGFLDGVRIEQFINKQVNNTPLEQLAIPMYVVATTLKTGTPSVFAQGNTGQAVRASVSIPTMFVPTRIGQIEYVDGGLVSPVPVEIARQLGADVIIAVNILAQPENTATQNYWGLFNQNINVMQNRLAAYELAQADVIIQPDIREKAHIFDTKGRSQSIQAGVDAATRQIPQLLLTLQRKGIQLKPNTSNLYRVQDAAKRAVN